MKISAKWNKPLRLKLPGTALQEQVNKLMAEEMLATRNRIVEDAVSGHKGADGTSLRPYSRRYTNAILAGAVRGYDGTKKTSTATDLKISGLFWRSFQTTPIQNGAEAKFVGSHPLGTTKTSGLGRKAGDRKTGTGKLSLGGRLATRMKGGGGSISNSELAGRLYKMGFTGWLSFGKDDFTRITARVNKLMDSVLKKL